jgi:hypothetical protein
MEIMIKRINKQSAVILLPLSLVSFFFTDWRFALSILIGGLVGAVNLKGLVWSVNALFGMERASGKIVFLSIFRLLVVFCILIVLAAFKVINPVSLLIGLTVVFIIILKEGLLAARNKKWEIRNEK